MQASFLELIEAQWTRGKHVCVGLDVDVARLPAHLDGSPAERCVAFARDIVDATAEVAAAYKPNAAFFEALGADGPAALRDVIRHIHRATEDAPVIVDAKRADIANSNNGSVHYVFDYLAADAVTLHPYLGHEAVRPFLERADKGIFVLCRTSNPGAGELQDLNVAGSPLFLHVATLVKSDWNYNLNCGLVVGATYPAELATIRTRIPDLPLLIPGVGAQGGDLEATVRAAFAAGELRALVNASRAVLYASGGRDFASAARAAADDLHTSITRVVANLG